MCMFSDHVCSLLHLIASVLCVVAVMYSMTEEAYVQS